MQILGIDEGKEMYSLCREFDSDKCLRKVSLEVLIKGNTKLSLVEL